MSRRRHKGKPINGWLIIDKPSGMTSTHVVNRVKRVTDAAKAGHGGTLDPLATGVLPLALGEAIREYIGKTPAVLLANHGPVVAGKSLDDAMYAAEELEETAKLFLLLQNHRTRPLTPEQIDDLHAHFPS